MNEVAEKFNSVSKRADIMALEQAIFAMPQLEPDNRHHFGGGVYVRELRLPAGTVLTGKIHRFENMNILVSGRIAVATEEGVRELEGYQVIVSPPGTKRAGYAITDTIWLTIHPTEKTDLAEIEKDVIVESFELLEAEQKRLEE